MSKRLDILEIDAASFAGRVAHVAASELHGLVSYGTIGGIINWYDRGGSELTPEQINLDIDAAADYLATTQCGGEQLWHKLTLDGRAKPWPNEPAEILFTDLPFATQLAYEVFASVCNLVHGRIYYAQAQAENDLEVATRPDAPLKLEDSIFEPEERMGTLRPEAVIASGLDAVRRDLEAREQEAREALLLQEQTDGQDADTNHSSAGAPDPAAETGTAGTAAGEDSGSLGASTTGNGEASAETVAPPADENTPPPAPPGGEAAALSIGAKPDTPPAEPVGFDPLKIGEAPPAPKPNKGGRGKKKQKPA